MSGKFFGRMEMVVGNEGRMNMGVEEGRDGVMGMCWWITPGFHIFLVISTNRAPESIDLSIFSLCFSMTVNVNANVTTQDI